MGSKEDCTQILFLFSFVEKRRTEDARVPIVGIPTSDLLSALRKNRSPQTAQVRSNFPVSVVHQELGRHRVPGAVLPLSHVAGLTLYLLQVDKVDIYIQIRVLVTRQVCMHVCLYVLCRVLHTR